jgi:myosin V
MHVLRLSCCQFSFAAELQSVQFVISHYADAVTYTVDAWLDKNRGFMPQELMVLMRGSTDPLIASLFKAPEGAPSSSTSSPSKGKSPTVLTSFRASMRALFATLSRTSVRYVRCIKPNLQKAPSTFNGRIVLKQLHYTGVLAVAQTQHTRYPIAMAQGDFAARFSCIAPERMDQAPPVEQCRRLLHPRWIDEQAVTLGTTKVFMSSEVLSFLEKKRDKVVATHATRLQRIARGFAVRMQLPFAATGSS